MISHSRLMMISMGVQELVLVAKLQHQSLVRLLGVGLQQQEKLLVYELNRIWDTFLFGIVIYNAKFSLH
ncbi:putative CCR4-associated factor 1-like protein 7 [Iris pallida]|uniref:CCR4-associated factor 1-like protein 7 n=1 Tax=Iris pallida TaxID=29817 RepID=A0AAX6I9X5_IRIPA|nr:putative CCR4-associated factor 1-like protein 7 [Iris pallida]KAJ6849667.1 putative CCR4-associated factor 1-like protein 7 [Iris pallida]